VPFENVGEMLERLGGIDPRRVRSWPPPGKATEKDVLAILNRENRLFELVDGILVEKVMGLKESFIAGCINRILGNFVVEHDLGAVAGADGTARILPRLVRIPDVSFYSWAKLPGKQYPTKPIPDLAPDLAVEVLSEGNTEEEMQRKLKEYFLAGVRLVWFVDPEARTVAVYASPDECVTLTEKDTLTGGEVLPGFALPLRQLFARVPETTAKAKPPKRRGNPGRKNRP
jgi:Uma2 family endonuclease